MSVVLCCLFWALLPLLIAFEVLGRLTDTRAERARRMASRGLSQRVIAERLNCSRYRVRLALA